MEVVTEKCFKFKLHLADLYNISFGYKFEYPDIDWLQWRVVKSSKMSILEVIHHYQKSIDNSLDNEARVSIANEKNRVDHGYLVPFLVGWSS